MNSKITVSHGNEQYQLNVASIECPFCQNQINVVLPGAIIITNHCQYCDLIIDINRDLSFKQLTMYIGKEFIITWANNKATIFNAYTTYNISKDPPIKPTTTKSVNIENFQQLRNIINTYRVFI